MTSATAPVLEPPPGDDIAVRAPVELARPAATRLAGRVGTLVRFAAVALPVSLIGIGADPRPDGVLIAAVAAAVWLIALRHVRERPSLAPLALGHATTSAIGTGIGLAVVTLAAFWVPPIHLSPAQMISMAAAVFAASVLSETWLSRSAGDSDRVLVVGTRDGGRELAAEVGRHDELPFDCIGVVLTEVEAVDVPQPLHVLGELADLREIVLREKPDIIVLADVHARAQALRELLEAASVDFRVVGLHEFYEYAFGRVPVGELSPMWFMSLLHLYQRPYSRIVKRILDLALSSLALLVALPFVPLLAVLVRLSGPGPIVFRQTRLGEGGEPFEILKFRTMIDGAERPGAAVWAEQRDPRVTPIGRFLRATRLDEIPQLVNVLRGEMSIVGPRPERPEFLDVLADEVPHWTRRHLVKPGITGWAQVRRGYTRDMAGAAEKLSYDLWYVKHCGLVLDLAIAAKTAGTVFSSSDSR